MRAAELQTEAVYGCPELHRDEIRTARLVANPGCYATSIILGACSSDSGWPGRPLSMASSATQNQE